MNTPVLDGKVALVTGAGKNLGAIIARQLAAASAKVIIVSRTEAELTATAEKLGDSVLAVPMDISDPEAVRNVFAVAEEKFDGVDILINNAAVTNLFRIDEAADEQLQRMMNVNVLGASYCSRAAINQMRKRGCGDIINITSNATIFPHSYLTMYAASKAAMEALSNGLYYELRNDDIRVTALRLGRVNSNEDGGQQEAGAEWTPEVMQKYAEANAAQMAELGLKGMAGQTVADHIIKILCMPRDAQLRLVDLKER